MIVSLVQPCIDRSAQAIDVANEAQKDTSKMLERMERVEGAIKKLQAA